VQAFAQEVLSPPKGKGTNDWVETDRLEREIGLCWYGLAGGGERGYECSAEVRGFVKRAGGKGGTGGKGRRGTGGGRSRGTGGKNRRGTGDAGGTDLEVVRCLWGVDLIRMDGR